MSVPKLAAPVLLAIASLVVLQAATDVQAAKRKRAARKTTQQNNNASDVQFQIQLGTSDLQNAENVRRSRKLRKPLRRRGPDLVIRKYIIVGRKSVRVLVANVGNAAAGASKLRLTVRRINGTPVGRMTHAKTPPIPAKSFKWVSMSAKSILPLAVALKSTTFRLDADVSNAVAETNEKNNRKWHNLP